MKRFLLCAMLLAGLLLAACGAQMATETPAAEPPAAEQPIIAEPSTEESAAEAKQDLNFSGISTTDIYGNEVDGGIFADYELTMVNIWATYCSPCIEEMPDLGELATQLPEGTRIIGLVADAMTEEYLGLAKTIVEETGANFTHLAPDQEFFSYVYYYVVGVPTTIFIDSAGNLVGKQLIGAQPRQVYEEELKQRLEQVRNREETS